VQFPLNHFDGVEFHAKAIRCNPVEQVVRVGGADVHQHLLIVPIHGPPHFSGTLAERPASKT
jgi:hypothetical protein